MMENLQDLLQWFRLSGVDALHSCIGPLPQSGAALGRWSSDQPDLAIRTVHPHPGSYRLALMLEPLEACVWSDNMPIWGGTIAAHRFRLCPPGEHGQWSRMSSCDIVNLFIPVALVEAMAAQRGDPAQLTLSVPQFIPDRTVSDLVRKMLDAPPLAGPLAGQVCDSLVIVLVAYLLEHYSQQAAPAQEGGLTGARLRRVLRHIAGHTGAAASIADLAALCGLSQAHFSREFHRAVGMPPHRYMVKKRLERAAASLLGGEARILDVAQESGFHSASHFARAFSSHYGLSPLQYRAQRRRTDLPQ